VHFIAIKITCPLCGKKGQFEISNEVFKNSVRGILAVNIQEKVICPHSFLVYVDKNLVVRDYFTTDYKLELPEIASSQIKADSDEIERQEIDVNVIKSNFHALLITIALRAIFVKEKIVFVIDHEFLKNQIIHFFDYITNGSFKFNFSVISSENYKNLVNTDKEALYFLIEDIWAKFNKIKTPKELKVEKRIVQNFFSEQDNKVSLIILKNEIQRAFKLSITVKEYIENYKEKEKIYAKNILDYLENKYNIKLSLNYLNLLIDIVKNYHNIFVDIRLANVSSFW
jgi:hypothetical protein